MSIANLKSNFGEFAKDTKLNLSSVISQEGAEGLSKNQIFMIALASAYVTKDKAVINAVEAEAAEILSDVEIQAAQAAATIMGMNNIYYRFVHLVSDADYGTMPAKLRMNVIGSPGVEKVDFELMSLAVSAINGCGMCIDAHVNVVAKDGVSKLGIQSSIRIAAVINAAAQAQNILENASLGEKAQAA